MQNIIGIVNGILIGGNPSGGGGGAAGGAFSSAFSSIRTFNPHTASFNGRVNRSLRSDGTASAAESFGSNSDGFF